jgi:hypothetical protein
MYIGELCMTNVVNLKKSKYDVYIGRSNKDKFHYGNPFTYLKSDTLAKVVVDTREESIKCYRDWLLGNGWGSVEPERRLWILQNLKKLKGRTLGCFCKPLDCHGDVLAELAEYA